MALPGNWTIEDMLTLSMFKKVYSAQLRNAVELSNNLDDLLTTNKRSPFLDKFKQESLFGNDTDELRELALRQIDLCIKNNIDIITYWDDIYPVMLKNIYMPPAFLFVQGKLQSSDALSIAMVGTRKNSAYGKLIAEKLASEFARAGIIVTSGLAYGIDTICHLSAVKAGGVSYAVMASGLDMISPALSKKNADRIVESGGAIISEYKCGTGALIAYFPQRNRIISGLSRATVIIESGEKGGSLITAKFAVDESRELFAVPGNINSQKSVGTNLLIKSGMAIPALSADSVMSDLGISKKQNVMFNNNKTHCETGSVEEKIFDLLSHEPMHIDEIASTAQLNGTEVLVKLLEMEFRGIIRQLPGKHYIKEF